MPKITLYQFGRCPYCADVRDKLEEKGLSYEKVEVSCDRQDPLRKEIAQKSGVSTVPVIRIDDRYIGESRVIIAELEKL